MKKFAFAAASLVVCCTLLMTASVVMAGTRPQATAQSRLEQVGVGREVVMSDLPDRSPSDIAGFKQSPVHRNPHFTDAQYQAAKEAASRAGLSTRPGDAAANQLIPRQHVGDTPGNFFDILGQSQGCNGLGWVPSDMGLAVGGGFVVQTVNECIAVYSTAGALLKVTDLCTFIGQVPNSGGAGCFDPRATYDFVNKKFIVVVDYFVSGGNGTLYVATSQTSNPTGLWTIHSFDRGPGIADYPTLGQTWGNFASNPSNSVVTVCDNFFANNGGFYSECLLLPKKKLFAAPGFSFNTFAGFNLGGLPLDTLQPVNVYEPGEKPRAQFAIQTLNFNGSGFCGAGVPDSGVIVWSFSNSVPQAGSPGPIASGFWTGCGTTSQYTFPGAADNASFCSSCIETLDNRITGMVHYSAGRLFPTIDTNNGGTSAILGWAVHPYLNDNGGACTGAFTNLCATLSDVKIEQEFCYDCGGGHSGEAYFGDIAPTPENNWTMYATFSNTGTSPGQFYTSNRVTWNTPFHDGGIFSCQANNAYSGRWGDYSAAAPDIPGVKGVPRTWGSGMYTAAGGWGTCISANAFKSDGDL